MYGRGLTFRQKLLLGFSLAIVVVFTVGGTATYLMVREQLLSQVRNQMDGTASGIHLLTRNLIANSIKNYLKGIAETNVRFAEFVHARQRAGTITEGQAKAEVEAFLKSQPIGHSGYMTAVDITHAPDLITVAVHPKVKGADITGRAFAQQMARQRNGYMEFPWRNPDDEHERRKSQWMIYFEPWNWIINVSPYLDEYPQLIDISGVREELAKLKVGERGFTMIMDMDGKLLMHPVWEGRNVMGLKDAMTGRPFVADIINSIRDAALKGNSAEAQGTINYHLALDNGEIRERILTYRFLPDVNWILAVVVGADEIERPLALVRNGLIVAVATSVLLAMMVAIWVTRPAFAAITALTRAAREMEAGRLDAPLPRASGDEIGVLSHAFAAMAARLKTYTEGLEQLVEKRAAELHASEERLRTFKAAVDHSSAAIVITDRDARIQYVNNTFRSISGYDADEVLGQTPQLVKSGRTPRDVYKDLWATILAGRGWRGEFLNRRKDGSLYWEEASIAPVLTEKGDITHFVAVKSDVTERRRLMEELTNARNRAEEGARAKSAFLATMSHEIRTPMNAVMGYCHLLKDTSLDDEQRRHLSSVTLAAEALLHIIDDILDYSKIEAGRLTLESKAFDPRRLIRDAVKVLDVRAREKGLVLDYQVAPDVPPRLVGDRHRLSQVLLNLVGNAIKFTETGSVVVTLASSRVGPEQVAAVFSVMDSGIGMTAAQMELLFQPFSQADSSTTRRFGGTGLGLTICARLVEMMEGRIWAESRPGNGSTFHFTARLGIAGEETEADAAPVGDMLDVEAVKGAIVLLVEDNPVNRQVATQFLKRWGAQVRTAENGLVALDILTAEGGKAADLVLMDMHMPVMDGCEATRRIRRLDGLRSLPIIALTANALPEERRKCFDAGMNDYLAKPFDPATFLATLARWLGG